MIYIEIIGTIAFAISGALAGIKAKMNRLGVIVLGATTACGGGIIRDVIIGKTPPGAFVNPIYILIACATALLMYIPYNHRRIDTDGWVYFIADAMGLGLFTVVGAKAGAAFNNPFLSQFLGVVTGVGGGVLRDIFANKKPAIFIESSYALSSIIGALCFIALQPLNENIAAVFGAMVIFAGRILVKKILDDREASERS